MAPQSSESDILSLLSFKLKNADTHFLLLSKFGIEKMQVVGFRINVHAVYFRVRYQVTNRCNIIVQSMYILHIQGPAVGTRLGGGGWGALCVEMGFRWTFPGNQDSTVKIKSELISIKLQQFFNTLADPKLIFPIRTILLMCKL